MEDIKSLSARHALCEILRIACTATLSIAIATASKADQLRNADLERSRLQEATSICKTIISSYKSDFIARRKEANLPISFPIDETKACSNGALLSPAEWNCVTSEVRNRQKPQAAITHCSSRGK